MDDRKHYLYWKEQLIGTITNVTGLDFPWLCGDIELQEVSDDIKALLTFISAMVEEEPEQLPELPFSDEMLENWFIIRPDGTKREISLPIVDFKNSDVTWR